MAVSWRRGRAGFARLVVVAGTGAGMALAMAPAGTRPRAGAAPPPDGQVVATGIVVRRERHGLLAVRVIEVDLAAPGVRVEVAAGEIALRSGQVTGRARTLPAWLRATGAVAGINGGFFGTAVGGEYRGIVGLLKREGRVRAAAPVYRARPSGRGYARAALGFTRAGRPYVAWVTSRPGDPQQLRRHPEPDQLEPARPWHVHQALACGPRLLREGKIEVTDRAERLVSAGPLPRTFVGFGGPGGAAAAPPRYLLLCAADGMEFTECARFLREYFPRRGLGACREGMALDGGGSTQAAWRERGAVSADPDPGTAVPTALLVHAR